MELGSTVRRRAMVVATALAAVAAGSLPGASAAGDSAVVVRGTDLPAGNRAQLTLVGCDAVFNRGAAVRPMIGVSQGSGAVGKRSLAFDPAGGNAAGVVGYVESMASTTVAGVSVQADGGTTGVAYAGYQAPRDAGTTLMWIGRADVAAPAGSGWSAINVPGLGYSWTQYDMSTQKAVASAGSSGVPAFIQAMGGDGYGFYAVGLGCDGNPFNLDGWRIGSPGATASYDFEGYRTTTTIDGPGAPVEPGTPVTLTGHVVDGSGAPVAGRAVLEAKQDGAWETVDVAEGPNPSAVVRPDKTTKYRWKFFDRARYEGSESEPFTVEVADPADPGDEPSETPTDQPSDQPSEQPSDLPTAPASSEAPAGAPSQPAEAPAETTPPPAETPQTPPPDPEPVVTEEPTEQASVPAEAPADPPADEPSAPASGAAEVPEG